MPVDLWLTDSTRHRPKVSARMVTSNILPVEFAFTIIHQKFLLILVLA